MDENNVIFVEQNFRTKDPDFNRDAKFTITERIEKIINTKSTVEKKDKSIRY